jgi:lysophospholipase L1-like esterase
MKNSRFLKTFFVLSVSVNMVVIGLVGWGYNRIGSLDYLGYLIENRGSGQGLVQAHRRQLFDSLAQQRMALRRHGTADLIIMLGNSLTAGAEWSELLNRNNVLNRGIIGDDTHGILSRLTSVTDLKPKKIFLLIGINDLLRETPQYIAAQMVQILTAIKQKTPQTTIFVESLLPVHHTYRRNPIRNADIRVVNDSLRHISTRLDAIFLDIYPQFADTNGNLRSDLSSDGIHLNGKGYMLLATQVRPFMD